MNGVLSPYAEVSDISRGKVRSFGERVATAGFSESLKEGESKGEKKRQRYGGPLGIESTQKGREKKKTPC